MRFGQATPGLGNRIAVPVASRVGWVTNIHVTNSNVSLAGTGVGGEGNA
jgi:hypothetical protein